MYTLLKQEGMAKRARMETVHGTIETPVFMNVATAAAIKGGLSAGDLRSIDTQVALCNTYHLHVRTGDRTIHQLGGLHHFMRWDRPILTDSGGFQVFSLAELRKIKEEGVWFRSHIDGAKIFMGPEESIQIQSNLGSTIAMAFDECPPALADREYVTNSVDRTTRWLERCRKELARLNEREDTVNRHQLLFGINQGAIYHDIRIRHAREISDMDLDGYAIGGLAVGEPTEKMYEMLELVCPLLPEDRPRYLMGVGTPANILEAIGRGVDMFDCVMPTRNGRNGMLFTRHGVMNMRNAKWAEDFSPIEEGGASFVDRTYTKAYLHHLFVAGEMFAAMLASEHNLAFYLWLVREARAHVEAGDFAAWKAATLSEVTRRI